MDYEVKLEIFEGPLDLLLHLIRKNEVDIFDIPIAIITDQYLEYLDILKGFNINLAGEFFIMASTLIHIKSKMLLPSFDENDEEEDPRIEVMQPLLEYIRLREIAGELSERELLDRDVFTHGLATDYQSQFQGEESLLDISLFQLIDAFKRIVDQRLPGVSLNVNVEKWSLKKKTSFIMEQLKKKKTMSFYNLFKENRTISEFIITFLALLELVHIGLIRIFQPEAEKDIRLEARFDQKEDNDNG